MKLKALVLAAALAMIGAGPALAQAPQAPQVALSWLQLGKIASPPSVSSSSSRTALTGLGGDTAWVCNTGSTDAYIALGGSTVVATTTGSSWLKAGTCAAYALKSTAGMATYVAAITASSTTTLAVETGIGTPPSLTSSSGGGGGGGTSSTFGAAFPSTGTAVGMSQGGNMVALTGTSGNLNVQCANCSGSGASATDGAAFTAGSSTLAPGGGFYQTTATANPLTNGQQGMWQMTAQRAGFVNLRNASGAELGIAAAPLQVSLANTAANATAVKVDGSAATQPVSGTVTVQQATAASLNATVVGTGTFATQAAQSGTWTVQPGNTANTTAWLVTGTGGTFPATQSGTWNITNITGTVSLPTGASTAANQSTISTNLGAQADAACGTATGNCSLIGLVKYLNTSVNASIPAGSALIGDVNLRQGGTALSTTNGIYSNLLQGNAAISATNGLYTNLLQGNAVIASGNPLFAQLTAGSAIAGKFGIDQTTPGTTNGAAVVGINSATALAGNGVTGAGSLRVTLASDNSALPAAGQGATAASVPAGATQAAGAAQNAEATAVTNGQLKALVTDLVGKLIVLPYANPENFLTGTITTAMTGTTDTAVTGMGAQGAGVRVYVTGCVISNSSSSVGTDVVLKDGSGGTVLTTLPAAINYGGTAITFPTPLKTTANTALFAANITTGSSTKVSCTGYKGI